MTVAMCLVKDVTAIRRCEKEAEHSLLNSWENIPSYCLYQAVASIICYYGQHVAAILALSRSAQRPVAQQPHIES